MAIGVGLGWGRMGNPHEKRSNSRTGLLTIASAGDRARSFRQARRHTVLVRFGRFVLPVIAVVSLGAYSTSLLAVKGLKSKGIDPGVVTIDPKNLTMQAPKYDGFGKDGAHYQVRAREAVTDLRQTGPVRLNGIEGEITQTTGVVTRLKANWGTYDQRTDVLELFEKIDVDASTGMTARLTRATVFPKESRVISSEPVVAQAEAGEIRAQRMALNSKTRQATFNDAVHVRLKPAATKADGPATGKAVPKGSGLPGLAGGSTEPIEIKSQQLDVDDTAKTALFRRDVIARQGDAVLEAAELDVLYEGRAAIGDAGAPSKDGEPQTKLKLIKARGGVVMTNKDDKASAQTLDFDAALERVVLAGNVVMTSANERQARARGAELDQKAETALLTGDVVVTQGRNTLKGQRMFVDRKAGKSRLESPAEAGRAAGRIQTVLYQNAAQKPDAGKGSAKASEAALANPFGTTFKSDPNQPIEIDAETLDISDQTKQAVYRGNVVAKQGEFVVEAVLLTAHYTGQAGIAGELQSAAKQKGEASQSAQLKKVEARQKVRVLGRDGQKAEGDNADFDVKANRIVLWGGKIRVEQPTAGDPSKKNVVEGPPGTRFVIDMTTGESKFEQIAPSVSTKSAGPALSAAGPASDSTSSTAAARSTEPQKPRMRAVFHPNQIGDAAKEKAGAAAKDRASSSGLPVGQGQGGAGSSGWEARTTGSPEKR